MEIHPECSLEGQILKLKLPYFGHLMRREDSPEKILMLGKCEGQEEKGTTEDEVDGQGHRSDQHDFDPAPGGSGRQEGAWRALVHGVTKSRT